MMKSKKELWWALVTLAMVLFACGKDPVKTITDTVTEYPPVAIEKMHDQTVFVHYMPWFETKASSPNNAWGIHWTMANKNPDVVDGAGKRQIASHYYPLIGPYHSGDAEVIEYHLLLMKYAGIDGVLIDWYGSYDVNDYRINRENTEALLQLIDKVGLTFAIVYEDRTLEHVVNAGLAATAKEAAKTDMRYLQSTYFNHPAYYKEGNQPLLLVFGPDRLNAPEDWIYAFNGLAQTPVLLTLNDQKADAGVNAAGEYAWVFDGDADKEQAWYDGVNQLSVAMGSAYPGFHDYYKEGGWGDNYFVIDHEDGATLRSKLQNVKSAGVDMVQLVTWNDFGEGTMLEPTSEFGFSFLETIHDFNEVKASKDVFQSILNLYTKRLAAKGEAKVQKQLDQAFYYLVSLQTEKAIEVINSIDAP